MKVNLAYKYRLILSPEQKAELDRRFAITRRAWNFMLEWYNKLPKDVKPSDKYKIIRKEYREYLKAEENEWQVLNNKRYLEYLFLNMKASWSKYWSAFKKGDVARVQFKYKAKCELTGKKFNQKRHDGFYKPKFKSFRDKQSYQTDIIGGGSEIDIENGLIKIDKHSEWMKFKLNKDDKILSEQLSKIGTLSFSRSPSGKYHISICIEVEREEQTPEIKTAIGVDFGVSDYAILSTGIKINVRSTDKIDERIKTLQQRASWKYLHNKDNENWNRRNHDKLQRQIKRLQERRANIRRYDTHHYTKFLTDNFDIIGIEDLNVKGMTAKSKPKKRENGEGFARNAKKAKSGLSKKILDKNPHETKRQLEYKAAWKGKVIGKADKFFASSKTCNTCGEKNTELKLSDRQWTCTECGTIHDRDLNAAYNLRDEVLDQAGVNTPDLKQNAFQLTEEILQIKEEIITLYQLYQLQKSSVNGENLTNGHRRQNRGEKDHPELCKFLTSTHLQIEKVREVIAVE